MKPETPTIMIAGLRCAITRRTPRGWTTIAREVHFSLIESIDVLAGAPFIAEFELVEDVLPGDQIVFGEQVFEVTGQIVSSGDLANRVACVEIGAAVIPL